MSQKFPRFREPVAQVERLFWEGGKAQRFFVNGFSVSQTLAFVIQLFLCSSLFLLFSTFGASITILIISFFSFWKYSLNLFFSSFSNYCILHSIFTFSCGLNDSFFEGSQFWAQFYDSHFCIFIFITFS